MRNNLHDDTCHRMIWGSNLNCSKFNFLSSIIRNASIRKSDQQTKIEENTCINLIIGGLQALCMVFKTYKLWEAIILWVWLTLNRDWHGCVYCDYITFPASINASGIDQRTIHPWNCKVANLSGSVHIQLYFYSRRF